MTLSLRWVSVAVLILAAGPAVGQGGRDRSVSTVAGLTQALAAARPGTASCSLPGGTSATSTSATSTAPPTGRSSSPLPTQSARRC
ncbi:MAG: hypothetical protein U0871_03760 [Gemmataceae bacterium]